MDAENISEGSKIRQKKTDLHKKLRLIKENYDRESRDIWKELANLTAEGKDLCKITYNGCSMVPDGNYAYADLVCTRCGSVRYR